jgi:hypothetical protein
MMMDDFFGGGVVRFVVVLVRSISVMCAFYQSVTVINATIS